MSAKTATASNRAPRERAVAVDMLASYAAEKFDACADAVSGDDVERADPDLGVAERHRRFDLASTPLAAAVSSLVRCRGVVELQTQPATLGHSWLADHGDVRVLRREDVDDDL